MFAPLEYGDADAAVLHMSGTWKHVFANEMHVQVTSLEEIRQGEAPPPISRKEIEYAAGKSLGRPLKLRSSSEGESMMLELNEYLEKRVMFMRLDDRLREKDMGPLPAPSLPLHKLPASAAAPGGSHYQSQKLK